MNKPGHRISRRFQPAINDALESREVPAGLATFNPVAFLNSRILPVQKSRQASPADWNSVQGWSWLAGTWNLKISSGVFNAFASALDKSMSSLPFPIQSFARFDQQDGKYFGKPAVESTLNPGNAIDGLIITPGQSPTLTFSSADGSPPLELKMTKSSKNSITFQGSEKMIVSVTDFDGKTTVIDEGKTIPIQATIRRNNLDHFRLTYEMKSTSRWMRIYSFSATRAQEKV
ncbi:MAG: hypothetical protein ACKO5E_08115 [bacterium]